METVPGRNQHKPTVRPGARLSGHHPGAAEPPAASREFLSRRPGTDTALLSGAHLSSLDSLRFHQRHGRFSKRAIRNAPDHWLPHYEQARYHQSLEQPRQRHRVFHQVRLQGRSHPGLFPTRPLVHEKAQVPGCHRRLHRDARTGSHLARSPRPPSRMPDHHGRGPKQPSRTMTPQSPTSPRKAFTTAIAATPRYAAAIMKPRSATSGSPYRWRKESARNPTTSSPSPNTSPATSPKLSTPSTRPWPWLPTIPPTTTCGPGSRTR